MTSWNWNIINSQITFAFECLPEECWEIGWIFLLTLHIQPLLQAEEMDVAYWSSTFTSAEKRIVCRSSWYPTEPALLVLVLLVCLHNGWNLLELFPFFIVGICEYRVWTVPSFLLLFLLWVNIHRLTVTGITNFLDGKLDTTDLKNVFLLNFIIDFLIVMLQAAHDKVHLLMILSQLSSSCLLCSDILFMVLESCTL